MKVVFAGPSVSGVDLGQYDFEIRGPARQGSLLAAVQEGAAVIGLVDGWFGTMASVWHKEILFALQAGARVYGASSMGALRAAECAAFGMVPVGKIAKAYLNGDLDDDAAVALTSGPEELGYAPFVEPLVDVWPTVSAMLACGEVSVAEAEALNRAAGATFFEDRTVEEMVRRAFGRSKRRDQIHAAYESNRVSQKRIDAIELLELVMGTEPRRIPTPDWRFENSPFWRSQLATSTSAHASLTPAMFTSAFDGGNGDDSKQSGRIGL